MSYRTSRSFERREPQDDPFVHQWFACSLPRSYLAHWAHVRRYMGRQFPHYAEAVRKLQGGPWADEVEKAILGEEK